MKASPCVIAQRCSALQTPEEQSSQQSTVQKFSISTHSKLYNIPSLVNELIAERDKEYKEELSLYANTLASSCLQYFKTSDSSCSQAISVNYEGKKRGQMLSATKYDMFKKARERIERMMKVPLPIPSWVRIFLLSEYVQKDNNYKMIQHTYNINMMTGFSHPYDPGPSTQQ